MGLILSSSDDFAPEDSAWVGPLRGGLVFCLRSHTSDRWGTMQNQSMWRSLEKGSVVYNAESIRFGSWLCLLCAPQTHKRNFLKTCVFLQLIGTKLTQLYSSRRGDSIEATVQKPSKSSKVSIHKNRFPLYIVAWTLKYPPTRSARLSCETASHSW